MAHALRHATFRARCPRTGLVRPPALVVAAAVSNCAQQVARQLRGLLRRVVNAVVVAVRLCC